MRRASFVRTLKPFTRQIRDEPGGPVRLEVVDRVLFKEGRGKFHKIHSPRYSPPPPKPVRMAEVSELITKATGKAPAEAPAGISLMVLLLLMGELRGL